MKVLVTGSTGFLGGAIARRLAATGDHVRAMARSEDPELAELGIEQHRGDISDPEPVSRAVQGVDIVFHAAAKTGVWGPRAEYYKTNVTGTVNIIHACLKHGVSRLVYTSSPSVVFDGRDMDGVDESAPYAGKFLAAYPETKALAEREVRAANGPDLGTVVLRPHLIWGPRDPHLVPRIIKKAKAGHLRRIGNRDCLIDTVYIDNAVDAHILAGERIAPGTQVAGKVYFISNGEPLPQWDVINRILEAAGLPPVTKSVPYPVALAGASLLELTWKLLRRQDEPRATRFVVHQLSTAHWFDINAARKDLGYEPRVSIDEGMMRLKEFFSTGAFSSGN